MSNKVILTYKRKRFSSHSGRSGENTASCKVPKTEEALNAVNDCGVSSNVNVTGDCLHDSIQNANGHLSCGKCSGASVLCDDQLGKRTTEEKCRNPAYLEQCNTVAVTQQSLQEFKTCNDDTNIEGSNQYKDQIKAKMANTSCINLSEADSVFSKKLNPTEKTCCTHLAFDATNENQYVDKMVRPHLPDLNTTEKSDSIDLSHPGDGSNCIGCPNGDNLEPPTSGTNDIPLTIMKGGIQKIGVLERTKNTVPWITFTRRAKMKKDAEKNKDISKSSSNEMKEPLVSSDNAALVPDKSECCYRRLKQPFPTNEDKAAASSIHLECPSGDARNISAGSNFDGLGGHHEHVPKKTELLPEPMENEQEIPDKIMALSLVVENDSCLEKVHDTSEIRMSPVEEPGSRPCVSVNDTDKDKLRGGEQQQTKTLGEILHPPTKVEAGSLLIEGGIRCRQESWNMKATTSSMNLEPNRFCEQVPTGNLNHSIPYQAKSFPSNVAERSFGSLHCSPVDRPTAFTDFLGGPAPPLEVAADCSTDLRNSCPTSAASQRKYNFEGWLSSPALQASVRSPPLLGHRQVVDDILMSTRMLSQRQGLSWRYRRHTSHWSEEELDSLWIGIRRHGRNNWTAMLRDPRLCFSPWRVAEDLAQRWEIEQSKLFSDSAPRINNSSNYHSDVYIGKPLFGSCSGTGSLTLNYAATEPVTSRTDTPLSLGGAYIQKAESFNRSPFHPLDVGPSVQVNGTDFCNQSLWKNVKSKQCRIKTTQRSSILEHNIAGRISSSRTKPARAEMPHWLKDVAGSHSSRLIEPALGGVCITPSTATVEKQTYSFSDYCEPSSSKDYVRGILKRNLMVGNMETTDMFPSERVWMVSKHGASVGGLTASEETLPKEASDRKVNIDLNRNSPDPLRSELVIIDSGASSEETISDNGRV